MDETLSSLAAARTQHNPGRTGGEDAFGDASDARFHPSQLRTLASARDQRSSRRISDQVWDQGTLSKERFKPLRASSAVKPEESLSYEAGADRLSSPASKTSRISYQGRPSVDLSSITPVEMAAGSPRVFSSVEFAAAQSGTHREFRQQKSHGYTFDPEVAAQQAPTPPTPQQLAWRSIQAASSRQSQLAAGPVSSNISGPAVAASGLPGPSPSLQYKYGGVALLQGSHMAVPPPTGSDPIAPATATEPAVVEQENLSDTVSDSVSPALTGQPSAQPVLNNSGTGLNTLAQFQQRLNMSDARAGQAEDRLVDMARDVTSLLT